MSVEDERGEPQAPPRNWLRANGLAVAAGVVLLGILPGAGYLQWRWPKVRAEIRARLEAAPTEPEERLSYWLSFGEAQIQSRLAQLRFSGEHPWLVTHTVVTGDGPPEIWGLDLTSPAPAQVVRDGMRVELRFPAPSLLGRGVLRGDNADRVPAFTPGTAPDPSARADQLLRWFLSGVIESLPQDIPGAVLDVVVAAG